MRLQELLETSQISELFQPGKKNWSWGFRGSEEVIADFTINNIPYKFYGYTHPGTGHWEVEFSIDKGSMDRDDRAKISTSYGLTGTGASVEVMSTVTDIMREFLAQYTGSVRILSFTAAEPSRQALYKRMVSRLLPHWKMTTEPVGNGEVRINASAQYLDEGWKDTLTNLAVASGVAQGGGAGMMAKNALTSPSAQERPAITAPANPAHATQAQQRKGADPKHSLATQPAQATQQPTVSPEVKKDVVQTITKPAAKVLIATANKAGLKGAELAQFVAQCAHETANFSSLKEYGGKLDFKKYDPKHNPRKAKILGNKHVGDGAKYHGRGYIQLTGRDNYKRAGEALGLPLEKHPELVEKPEVAAKVAVWYWENRVRPNVDNFKDTRAVTKTINSGLKGLEDRHTKFAAIMDIIRNKG